MFIVYSTMDNLLEDRIWIDGCFDFFHHGEYSSKNQLLGNLLTPIGHANAILQAKQLGSELYIGIHTDDEITKNKGPTVMTLHEREFTIDANKWATRTISGAPYVTDPQWMNKYGCKYVVHGDDITTDSEGNDCYGIVRDQGRLKLVKRTEGVSTTELIERLLYPGCDDYYIIDVGRALEENKELVKNFATGEDGVTPFNGVWYIDDGLKVFQDKIVGECVYVEGSFDLFNPYHISCLKELGTKGPVVVGVYADGVEDTSMDLLQRALCVLQCKYVDSVVIGVKPDTDLDKFNIKEKHKINQGFHNEFNYLNNGGISKRIENHYDLYIERQAKKGIKHKLEQSMK